MLYLANDVIQTSKKKGPEYKSEFTRILPRALQLVSREKDNSLLKSVERIVNVWEERKVFEADVIIRFKSILGTNPFLTPSLTYSLSLSPSLPSVAGTLKPHRRTRSESDMKRAASLPEAKRSRVEKRQDSEEEPPNDRTPPEVRGGENSRSCISGCVCFFFFSIA